MFRKIRKILLKPFIWLLAIFFLVEEYLWDVTGRMMAKLGAISTIHRIETWISTLSAYPAMLVFLMPSTTLIPAKLIGLHVIAKGHVLLGGAIFLMAKIIGMALFSRIFNLTKPALLQLNWFKAIYDRILLYRNQIHAYLDSWSSYQKLKLRIKYFVHSLRGKGQAIRFFKRAAQWKRKDSL